MYEDKTREQLIEELGILRKRLSELEGGSSDGESAMLFRAGSCLDETPALETRVEERTREPRTNAWTLQASNMVLRLMTEASNRKEFLSGVVELIREWTGCRRIGVRTVQPGGEIPYEAHTGFSRDFMALENALSIHRDHCVCIRVITGQSETQDAGCMTSNGSFIINDSVEFETCLTREQLARFRGVCMRSGFRTIAVIPIHERQELIGCVHIADERPFMLPRTRLESIEQLAGLIGEGAKKFSVKEELDRQKELLQTVLDQIPVIICAFDPDGRPILTNSGFERVSGWSLEDAKEVDFFAELHPDPEDRGRVMEYMLKGRAEWKEFLIRTRSGKLVETSFSSVRLKDGGFIGFGIDLREKKLAQAALERANRALRVLSESNYTILEDHDEVELFTNVCRIIVETGGYKIAWVGYAEDDEKKRVRPAASWGDEAAAYLDSIDISWADCEQGRGPTGMAIRKGKFQTGRDFFNDRKLAPWRERALQFGLRSSAAFPLIVQGQVMGALTVYSSDPDAFHEREEEVGLLNRLAENLAYGIGASLVREEHKTADARLGSYMRKLEESNEALRDFASVASHDMREPLRKIRRFGDMLKNRCGRSLDDTALDYMSRILKASGRMENLLDALLAYSRISTEAEPLTAVSLSEVVNEVLDILEVRIVEAGGRVETGILPTVQADPNQMHQLFQNLIGNALKYRGEESPVVRIHEVPDEKPGFVTLCVEDNGIGFQEEYAQEIFQPFQRLHGKDCKFEGTGMGLAICRKIVARHGGVITAKSKPGKGSRFIVSLPREGRFVTSL